MSLAAESLALRAHAEHIASHTAPGGIGRPPLESDPEVVNLILSALADGNYRETACRIAGISKQALYNILKRSERGDAAAAAFVDAMEKAEAMAEAGIVKNVRKASESPQFWAAGMTLLERRLPDRWGKRQDDASVPRVVVQIGARDSDVTVSVGSITSTVPTHIDATQVDSVSYIETHQVTEGSLSDADTGRIKVAAPQSATERAADAVPTRRRRGNPKGTHRERAGASRPRRVDSVKGR